MSDHQAGIVRCRPGGIETLPFSYSKGQGVNSYYLNYIYSKLLSTYPILVGLGPHKTDMIALIIDKISICTGSFWIWCYLTGRFVMPLMFPDIQIVN